MDSYSKSVQKDNKDSEPDAYIQPDVNNEIESVETPVKLDVKKDVSQLKTVTVNWYLDLSVPTDLACFRIMENKSKEARKEYLVSACLFYDRMPLFTLMERMDSLKSSLDYLTAQSDSIAVLKSSVEGLKSIVESETSQSDHSFVLDSVRDSVNLVLKKLSSMSVSVDKLEPLVSGSILADSGVDFTQDGVQSVLEATVDMFKV